MAAKLTAAEITDFRRRFPIRLEQIGEYGLVCRDRGRFVLVARTADHASLLYFRIPDADLPTFTDMAEGELRYLRPDKVTPAEATYSQIVTKAMTNPVFSTEPLEKALSAVSGGTGQITESVIKGLSAAKVFGVPVVLVAGVGVALYAAVQVAAVKRAFA